MKKFLASILTLALCLGLATGCAGKQTPAENDTESAGETGVKEIPSLKIAFSPTPTRTRSPPPRSLWSSCFRQSFWKRAMT